jgi:alpha-amylase
MDNKMQTGEKKAVISDLDNDGLRELVVNTRHFKFYFKLEYGASICEWDYKDKSLNLVNTIMRRREKSHQLLKKRDNLRKYLFYDRNPRYSLLDHFLEKNTEAGDLYKGKYRELGDFVDNRYDFREDRKTNIFEFRRIGSVKSKKVEIVKILNVKNKTLLFTYRLQSQDEDLESVVFGIEFNFSIYDNLLSGKLGNLKVKKLKLNDLWHNIKFNFEFEKETNVFYFPVETISRSERNLEKLYQELCIVFCWPVNLTKKNIWEVGFALNIN